MVSYRKGAFLVIRNILPGMYIYMESGTKRWTTGSSGEEIGMTAAGRGRKRLWIAAAERRAHGRNYPGISGGLKGALPEQF